MTRPWGATGVFAPEDVELSSDAKEQISQIIVDYEISVSRSAFSGELDRSAFFDELDKGLSRFKGYAHTLK